MSGGILGSEEWVLFVFLLALLASLCAEPVRWRYWFRGNAARPLFRIYFLSGLVSYLAPAKLGIPVRLWLLAVRGKVPVADAITALAADGVLVAAHWLGLSVAAAVQMIDSGKDGLLTGLLPNSMPVSWLVLVLVLVFAIGYRWTRRRRSLLGIRFATVATTLPRNHLLALEMLLLGECLAQIGRHVCLFYLFGVEGSVLDHAALAVLASFVGLISMMPMGLGGYDLTLVAGLQLFGVSFGEAAQIIAVNRVASVGLFVLTGGASSLSLGLSFWRLRRGSASP